MSAMNDAVQACAAEMQQSYTGQGDYAATPDQHAVIAKHALSQIRDWWPVDDGGLVSHPRRAERRIKHELHASIRAAVIEDSQQRATAAAGPEDVKTFGGILTALFMSFVLPALINWAISAIIKLIFKEPAKSQEFIASLRSPAVPDDLDASDVV